MIFIDRIFPPICFFIVALCIYLLDVLQISVIFLQAFILSNFAKPNDARENNVLVSASVEYD